MRSFTKLVKELGPNPLARKVAAEEPIAAVG